MSSAHPLSDLTDTGWVSDHPFRRWDGQQHLYGGSISSRKRFNGPSSCLRPVRTLQLPSAGWIYMSISDRLILDYLKSFPLNPDSFLCLTIGDRTWLYENDRLKPCDWKFEPVKDLSENAFNSDTSVSLCRLPDGSKRVLLSCPIGNYGWSISLLLSQSAMKAQSSLLCVHSFRYCCLHPFYRSFVFCTVKPFHRTSCKKAAASDPDHRRRRFFSGSLHTVEDEFGAIGTGINRMSQDLAALIQKRVQDEKERKDLEYPDSSKPDQSPFSL